MILIRNKAEKGVPMTLEIFAGGLLCALSALFFYAGSRNQRMLPKPMNARIANGLALAALVAGAALLLRHMGSGSAIFTAATILMTLFSLLPFLVLLRPDAGDTKAKGARRNG